MIKRWLADWCNKRRPKVFIEDDHVIGIDGKRRFSVPLVDIEAILDVFYENPGAFDIDEFCILLLKDRFFLIGACAEFAANVYIHHIKALRPSLTIIPVWFDYIPYRLRAKVCWVFPCFDLTGMGMFPLSHLPKYRLREDTQMAI